jgi:hypothetical protein
MVITTCHSIPVVLPRRALDCIDPEPWWDKRLRDFEGGDHYHLCITRYPKGITT